MWAVHILSKVPCFLSPCEQLDSEGDVYYKWIIVVGLKMAIRSPQAN